MKEQLNRLGELLEVEELDTLICAIETVKNSSDGYGTIAIEIVNRWLIRAMPTPSIKTKAKAKSLNS